jgi:hypothetical protein
MQRREFLLSIGGGGAATLSAAIAGRSLAFAQDLLRSPDAMEQRVAEVVEAYDGQGNHRTATPADSASADWLAGQVRQAGAAASLEPFALNRVDPLSCYVRIGDRRIDGVPLYDAAFTGADGVGGTLASDRQ